MLNGITIQTLTEYNGGAASAPVAYHYVPPNLVPNVASSQLQYKDPMQFWALFAEALNENPPPEDEIKSILPQFKYLGIELGKSWNPKGVNPIYLEEMKKAAVEFGPMMNRALGLIGALKNGWIIPPANTGNAGQDYMSRAGVAVFGLTANTVQRGHLLSSHAGWQQPGAHRREKVYHYVFRADAVCDARLSWILVADDV